jgi:thiamine monophosphate synthase
MGAPDLSLYLVTDTAFCGAVGVAATVAAGVGAGVSIVQLRDPDASDQDLLPSAGAWRQYWPVPACR